MIYIIWSRSYNMIHNSAFLIQIIQLICIFQLSKFTVCRLNCNLFLEFDFEIKNRKKQGLNGKNITVKNTSSARQQQVQHLEAHKT